MKYEYNMAFTDSDKAKLKDKKGKKKDKQDIIKKIKRYKKDDAE